jgi:hypothetical protein
MVEYLPALFDGPVIFELPPAGNTTALAELHPKPQFQSQRTVNDLPHIKIPNRHVFLPLRNGPPTRQ